MLREKCGVFGLYSSSDNNVAKRILSGLIALQHRGQEGCGISVFDGHDIRTVKGVGLVSEVFDTSIVSRIRGNIGIGHVRYSTTGRGDIKEVQPFVGEIGGSRFALAWNGTIANFMELRDRLSRLGFKFRTSTDTEVLAKLIAYYYMDREDFVDAIKESMRDLKGSYSAVLINDEGEFFAFRDPIGIKPLTYGFREDDVIVASESIAIESAGGVLEGDIDPGEILVVRDGDVYKERVRSAWKPAYCMFEYIYFSRPDSIINGISVYEVRYNLGRILARLYPVEADIVVPVPDTGNIAALGFSRESGIPISLGLIRNPYIGRTFIRPSQKLRELSVSLKLGFVKSEIRGKRVVLIDDSIVRGTTMRRVVKLLRDIGAKEVHVRITSPPIRYPCFLGIDFPTRRELIASTKTINEIKELINADSLGYMTIEGLIEGIGTKNLCLACLTGKYPIRGMPLKKLERIFEVMRK